MADFDAAYEKTAAHEGGYANDPHDRGGETYKGIARVFHPAWAGWATVDALRRRRGFPRSLDAHAELQAQVKTFYKEQFWDRFSGDLMPDQALAEELFDTAVNMGLRRAVRFLQDSVNLLNRNQRSYEDLVVDGLFGDKTLKALKIALRLDRGSGYVLKLMNIMQGAHYVQIMRSAPSQEKFARGWLKRA